MSSTAPKEKVSTFYRPIEAVTVPNIKQMYDLYASFYENTSLDIFITDLKKKKGVILVSRKSDDKIVGFSTQTIVELDIHGKRVRGCFSGDTIIDPRYWGNNNLGGVFYQFVLREKLRHPFTPFYWLLISKGYKTYMLMTNNLYKYYPSVEGNRPEYKSITEAYCEQLFPDAFDKENMLLNFGNQYVRLKETVAEITPELAAANPKIAYFEKMNPTWRRGTELPCLAALDLHSVFISLYARPLKWLQKRFIGHHKPAGLALARQLEAKQNAALHDADGKAS